MNDDLKSNIFTMSFVLFYNIESNNYFIMQPGMKKHSYLNKEQRSVIEQYKKYARKCKNLVEIAKMSKQYSVFFKEEYPEFYI